RGVHALAAVGGDHQQSDNELRTVLQKVRTELVELELVPSACNDNQIESAHAGEIRGAPVDLWRHSEAAAGRLAGGSAPRVMADVDEDVCLGAAHPQLLQLATVWRRLHRRNPC